MSDEKSSPDTGTQPLDRMSVLETRIDALIEEREKRSKRFIKDPSQVIAVAAFIISLATTLASAYRTYKQDTSQRKSDLRAVLLQLNANYLSGAEFGIKYQTDPAFPAIASYIRANNIVNAKQAYSILQEIGRSATSAEYNLVAFALQNANEIAIAEWVSLKALEMATNVTDYLGALRSIGAIKLAHGQVPEAEGYLRKAMNAFDQFPYEALNVNVIKHEQVASLLYFISYTYDCDFAKRYMAAVDQYFDEGPSAVFSDLNKYRQQLNNNVAQYCSSGTPPQNFNSTTGGNALPKSPPSIKK
jgi:hypothetical protein